MLVRISFEEVAREKLTPRSFHALLRGKGVKLKDFTDRGSQQPLADYLRYDFHRDLVAPWKYYNDPATLDFVVEQW